MLEELRKRIKELLDERKNHRSALEKVLEVPKAENRSLNEEESAEFRSLKDKVKEIDKSIDALRSDLDDMEEVEKRNEEREELAARLNPEAKPTGKVTSVKEPDIYREGGPNSFLKDLYVASAPGLFDPHASERLARYKEVHDLEYRAGANEVTSDFADLQVPAFLQNKFIDKLYAKRVTADLVGNEALPAQGMAFSVPRQVSSLTVAAQANQHDQVASSTYHEDYVNVDVRTYAGQVNVSFQALDRGAGVEGKLMQDLLANYTVTLASDVVKGAGTNGTHTGILNASGISTITATGDNIAVYKKILQAITDINSTYLDVPNVIVMHPRRWGALLSATDTNNRPLVLPEVNVPANVYGIGNADVVQRRVGQIHGVDVYTDALIPTNLSTATEADEDRIVVMDSSQVTLWENSRVPARVRYEQTLGGTLAMKLVLWDYSAFAANLRPEAIRVIRGRALATPTF